MDLFVFWRLEDLAAFRGFGLDNLPDGNGLVL